MAPPQSDDPLDTVALEQWLTGIDEEIAAIPDTEHRAAIDRILTEAGYHRDQDGHLRRTNGADHD